MIDKTITRNVTTSGLGETTAFTIAATGKAFRSLIDSVYTDKITTPVRELMTNAFDSHVDAGRGSEPFDIIAPTRRDPRFGVRDYGTGMDHETITGLYTTLFGSSKGMTNDQVGKLGLGSKSPFAYTDTFTVTAFDGSNKRVYTAFLSSDMPQLALLHEGASTERQGILVEFPVRDTDVSRFVESIGKVMIGFDLRPTVVNTTIDVPKPTKSGNGWATYKSGYDSPFSSGRVYVRQGCVIYPTPDSSITVFPHDYYSAIVIDVPIGTADITLSREALSWDDETRDGVVKYAEAAWEDATKDMQAGYDAQTTTYGKLKYRDANIPSSWWEKMRVSRDSYVNLMEGMTDAERTLATTEQRPGYVLHATQVQNHRYGSKQKLFTSVNVQSVPGLRFCLMDDTTPRRVSRMREWGKGGINGNGYAPSRLVIPVAGQADAVKRLTEVLELTPEQFIKVADLDDVDRETQAKASPVAKTLIQELQDKLDDGAAWMGTHGHMPEPQQLAKVVTMKSDWWNQRPARSFGQVYPVLYRAVTEEGERDVLSLTRAQREKLTLNNHNEVSNLIVTEARKNLTDVQKALTNNLVVTRLSHTLSYSAVSALLPVLGLTKVTKLGPLQDEVQQVAKALGQEILVDTDKVNATMDHVRKTYPMLFPLDEGQIVDYIQKQTNNQGATATS